MKTYIIFICPLVAIVAFALLVVFAKVPFTYNLRNIMVRWHTTALTALAFTLVVGLLTIMLAFVNGMYRMSETTGQPGNVIVLSDGATDEVFSNLAMTDTTEIELQPGVLRADANRRLVSKEVYVIVNQPAPAAAGQRPKRRFVQIRGIQDPEISARVHGIELLPGGGWFTPAGVRGLTDSKYKKGDVAPQAIEAVLGEGVAREMGLGLGSVFEVGPRLWVVVGIMQSMGTTFGSEVWAKDQIVGEEFGKRSSYSAIVLRTENAAAAKKLADDLKGYKRAALQALPETEYYARLSETNSQFLYAIVFVAVIMAVGGVFGVMNTMFAAISQRIRDVGVLRIIGFAPWQLLVSFFVEALVIALVGGLIGCALSVLIVAVLNWVGYTPTSIVSGSQGGGKSVVFKFAVDAEMIGYGVLFTLVMGALGGFLPALSVMRLRPLEALR